MNAATELALLIAIFISCANAVCPPDFVASTAIPGKCYYLTTTTNRFFPAINYCRNLTYGADILSITNEFENREVAGLLQQQGIPYPAWIGHAFYDNKSHWIATAAGTSNYSNWKSGIYNGYVAVIYSSGTWSYTNGANINSVICQLYPDDPTTFPPLQTICPAEWTPSISAHGKCYKLIITTDFFSAARECLTTRIGDSHAELVTLTSQLEMMELYTTQSSFPWTSLTRWEADGNWHWVKTLHPTNYFGPYNQPSTYEGGTCAYLSSFGLYGTPCWDSKEAVCQYFPNESPVPTPSSLICPQGGIASLTKPGTCYYVLGQHQSFQSAQSACRTLNTGLTHNDLFVPRTLPEYEEFETIASHPPVWLGLTSSNNGTWSWVSGRSSNITKNWCSGQPDTLQNPHHQCAFVNFLDPPTVEFCWTASDCTDSYAAVCQSSNTF